MSEEDVKNNREGILKIEGEIKLIHERIKSTDEKINLMISNHLVHVQSDIDWIKKDMIGMKKIMWFIGTAIVGQLLFLVFRSMM
jgi:hypothetical protein